MRPAFHIVLALALPAGAQTFQLTNLAGVSFAPSDNSCGAVKKAFAVSGQILLGCSTDPLQVGSFVLFNSPPVLPVRYDVVKSVVPVLSLPTAAVDLPPMQASIGSSSAAAPSSLSVTVEEADGTATPEQYKAMAVLFGAVLAAACLVWSFKRFQALFSTHITE